MEAIQTKILENVPKIHTLNTKSQQILWPILFVKALANAVGRQLCISIMTKLDDANEAFMNTKNHLKLKPMHGGGAVRQDIRQIVISLKNFEIGWRNAVIELLKDVSMFPRQSIDQVIKVAISNIFEIVVSHIAVKRGTDAEEYIALWEKKCA